MMKNSVISFSGAWHYIESNGYNRKIVFPGNREKAWFMDFLQDFSSQFNIKIYGYCVLDWQYCLVLENSSGRMPEFFKLLNTEYTRFYQKNFKDRTRVFEKEYQSILIPDYFNLFQAIVYLMNKPKYEGIEDTPQDYMWSSARHYFSLSCINIVDPKIIVENVKEEAAFFRILNEQSNKKPILYKTKYGEVFGNENFNEELFEQNFRNQ